MAVTMKDVAEHAGVSKSTVSQYLNKRYNYMSEETKRKIEATIKELNYTPNQIARSLKQKRTNVIAIVAATLSSRFTTELVSTIEKFFAEKGIDVIVASTDDKHEKEYKYVESLISRQVDGVIVFPTVENRGYYQGLKEKNFPLVFVDRELAGSSVDTILLDNRAAGKMATEYLIERNHKKIGILTFPLGKNDSITTRRERLNGYLEALTEYNISVDKKMIIQTTREQVFDQLDQLFAQKNHPTALILTNDMLLEEALLWAKNRNVSLPEDVSLISIDDVSFAHFFTPTITTISQPVREMGEQAATLLFQQIQGENSKDSQTVLFLPELKSRESVKKL